MSRSQRLLLMHILLLRTNTRGNNWTIFNLWLPNKGWHWATCKVWAVKPCPRHDAIPHPHRVNVISYGGCCIWLGRGKGVDVIVSVWWRTCRAPACVFFPTNSGSTASADDESTYVAITCGIYRFVTFVLPKYNHNLLLHFQCWGNNMQIYIHYKKSFKSWFLDDKNQSVALWTTWWMMVILVSNKSSLWNSWWNLLNINLAYVWSVFAHNNLLVLF